MHFLRGAWAGVPSSRERVQGSPAPPLTLSTALHEGNETQSGPRKGAKSQEDRNGKGEAALDLLGASSEQGSISARSSPSPTGFAEGCRAAFCSTERSRAQTANTGKVTPAQAQQARAKLPLCQQGKGLSRTKMRHRCRETCLRGGS